jgi:hypothetical protein
MPIRTARNRNVEPSTREIIQVERAFKWTKEAGLKPEPNVVLGFPGETKKSAWKTIKFVERLSPDDVSFYTIATPYPGTPMYDCVKENGWLRVTDFDKYDTATPIFETPTLSMKELRKLRTGFSKFLSPPNLYSPHVPQGTRVRFFSNKNSLGKSPRSCYNQATTVIVLACMEDSRLNCSLELVGSTAN